MSACHRQLTRLIHRFLVLLGVSFVCGAAIAIYAERLPIKTYTVADGLLRDTVYKIKQDSRGFLWFCTAEGVSRFDGYGFTNFTAANGLPNGQVNDFLETRNGEIYLATDAGIAKLKNYAGQYRKHQRPGSTSQSWSLMLPILTVGL